MPNSVAVAEPELAESPESLCEFCGEERDYTELEFGIACTDCQDRVYSHCEECMEPTYLGSTASYWLQAFALQVSREFPQFGALTAIRVTETEQLAERPELWQTTSGLAPRSYLPSAFGLSGVPTGRAFTVEGSAFLCTDCCHSCHSCGELYECRDNADSCCGSYCHDCDSHYGTEEEARDCCGSLRSYCYRPGNFRFWQTKSNNVAASEYVAEPGQLYLGLELELEQAKDGASRFLEQAGEDPTDSPEFCYIKSDGSLSGSGVELVTMPATYAAFRSRFPWQALADWHSNGARSYYYESCGLHVHVSRSAFTAPELWRFAKWQLWNSEFCQLVAQRETTTYARWSERGRVSDVHYVDFPALIKGKDSNRERYVALNFQNSQTVELRYFKGNLLRESILAKLGFVDSLFRFTKSLDFESCKDGALRSPELYLRWLWRHSETYPELVSFLRERGY